MRKSELGNLVAANMAGIMDSDEHRSLFRKQAESDEEGTPKCKCPKDCEKCKKDGECPDKCPCAKKDDASADCKCKCVTCKNGKCDGAKCTHGKKDDNDADTCECSDKCPCKDGGECNECAVTAKFNGLFESVLKMSETLDELGLSKSASNMIRIADGLLVEAAGADTIEEMLRENPDLDVDLAVVKEEPKPESEGEPRLSGLEFDDSELPDTDDIVAQLEAIEKGGPMEALSPQIEAIDELGKEGPDIGFPEGPKGVLHEDIPGLEGLEGLEAANVEVDAWLKKHAPRKRGEIELDASLSSLLTTAEKEVEDYLIEKNLSFEDEG